MYLVLDCVSELVKQMDNTKHFDLITEGIKIAEMYSKISDSAVTASVLNLLTSISMVSAKRIWTKWDIFQVIIFEALKSDVCAVNLAVLKLIEQFVQPACRRLPARIFA